MLLKLMLDNNYLNAVQNKQCPVVSAEFRMFLSFYTVPRNWDSKHIPPESGNDSEEVPMDEDFPR